MNLIPGLRRSARQADWQFARGEGAAATDLNTLEEKPSISSGIPSPINDRLFNALFSVSTRILPELYIDQ